MVVAYDMNRSLTYANSGAEKLTGYGLAELQVADFLSWTYPEDRPQVLALWDKVFGGQPVDQVDYRLIAKDGTVKWVTGAWGPVVEETGRQVGVRGTCRDITERVVAEQARQDAMQKFRTIVQEITERKRAEQALRESEERFRNMADTAPVMIWISGRDRLCTFFNKGWLDFTGRTLERELGNGWATGVHPDDLDRCFATYSSSFDACRTFQMEYRLRRADGEYRWVLCRGVPRFEPSGVFAGYIGSDTDITEQKRAAKELQSKFGQVQVLFELAGAVSRAQKPSEIYRAAVQGLVRAVGADRASVLIFDPHDVMRFEAWIGLSDEYRVAVEGHTPWRRGVRDAQPIAVADVMQDPSLSAYWQVFAQEGIRAVAFIPVLGNGGLIGKFMLYYNAPHEFQAEELQVAQTIATDVAFAAERQHAETALRDSEERFRATFFQAAVGIAQTNPDAKWLLLNDRFCEMLGYTPAELRGKTFLDFTHPDDREASLSAVRRLLADEISSWLTEKRYIRKDGAIVWVRLWVSLVRDQDKRPQYFISVVEDVTDRIEAERALRDSERRLALAQSGAHLGIWERDLRTNVKTISGEYAKLYGLPLDKRSLTYEE
jgi:PAS domain S-box-containing protein